MYISCLFIDAGSNPDRPRPGRLWLRNIYRVHQRMCMAFPSASRKSEDEDFLKPFKPEDFDDQVHVKRSADSGFLFRIEPQPGGRVMILVQSARMPNWEYAFHNAGYLLAAPPAMKSLDHRFTKGQILRFMLHANPVKCLSGERCRVPLIIEEEQVEWLKRKLAGGAELLDARPVGKDIMYFHKNRVSGKVVAVTFTGILRVKSPSSLLELMQSGIGPAKSFGCGMLTVARA